MAHARSAIVAVWAVLGMPVAPSSIIQHVPLWPDLELLERAPDVQSREPPASARFNTLIPQQLC